MRRQYYTSTLKAPVYASWKCEKCGEVNFATGQIVCRRTEDTASWRPSVIKATQERASAHTNFEWVTIASNIIFAPNRNGSAMYKHFFLQHSQCTKCGKKPRWNKNPKCVPLVVLSIPVSVISGIVAFCELTTVAAWLVFLASTGMIVWSIGRKAAYPKKMEQLPKAYTPVIGSFNPSLVRVAVGVGRTMPTPDECIAAVRGYNLYADEAQPLTATIGNNTVIPANFCRKCGTILHTDCDYCHKCGTGITNY